MRERTVLRDIVQRARHAASEDLPALADEAARGLGATGMQLYLVDHEQRELLPLRTSAVGAGGALGIDGTLAGRAYCTMSACPADGRDSDVRLWVPLLNGMERLGVVGVTSPTPIAPARVPDFVAACALLADVVVTCSHYSDTIEQVRRRAPMRMAAEVLRAQLPPLTFSTGTTIISGILEPSYDVGGDAFDYAINGDTAHLALFDAVGHGSSGGMRAVMLAGLALGAYRNARRAGQDLVGIYHHIDQTVRAHDRQGLITGILAELHQPTDRLRVISAGHPNGLIIRGGRVATVLPTPTALPVTMGDFRPPVVVEEALEPGDHVLLYTDGITDARSSRGEPFGADRLTDFTLRALADELPLPETARRLVHAILAWQDDTLTDDATLLMLRWNGPGH
ncbi:PP2C family protein-serine/threonine phosphatase [Micromonospora sediminicola]|uniref:PP2C family protein-serine/threonine phosphatase n=1 Tax=Micromonospora sediminicola TaxID=946078 RepID=UPI00339EAB52